jgi:hypothetical protein
MAVIGVAAGVLWFVRSGRKALEPAMTAIPLTTYPGFQNGPSFFARRQPVGFFLGWRKER